MKRIEKKGRKKMEEREAKAGDTKKKVSTE